MYSIFCALVLVSDRLTQGNLTRVRSVILPHLPIYGSAAHHPAGSLDDWLKQGRASGAACPSPGQSVITGILVTKATQRGWQARRRKALQASLGGSHTSSGAFIQGLHPGACPPDSASGSATEKHRLPSGVERPPERPGWLREQGCLRLDGSLGRCSTRVSLWKAFWGRGGAAPCFGSRGGRGGGGARSRLRRFPYPGERGAGGARACFSSVRVCSAD